MYQLLECPVWLHFLLNVWRAGRQTRKSCLGSKVIPLSLKRNHPVQKRLGSLERTWQKLQGGWWEAGSPLLVWMVRLAKAGAMRRDFNPWCPLSDFRANYVSVFRQEASEEFTPLSLGGILRILLPIFYFPKPSCWSAFECTGNKDPQICQAAFSPLLHEMLCFLNLLDYNSHHDNGSCSLTV